MKIEDWNVFLKLKGACGGCPHAQMTLKNGIEAILREQIDEKITVERAMGFISLMIIFRENMYVNISVSVIFVFSVYDIIYRLGKYNTEN